jgi:hypothetical protein
MLLSHKHILILKTVIEYKENSTIKKIYDVVLK